MKNNKLQGGFGSAPSFITQANTVIVYLNKISNKLIASYGWEITLDQIPVLALLYNRKNITQQEIAKVIYRDKSSITRTISSLERKGFIVTKKSVEDQRKKDIVVTEKGREVSELILEQIHLLDTQIVELMKNENVDILHNTSTLAIALEKYYLDM